MEKWIKSLTLKLRLKIDVFWRLKMTEDQKKLLISKVINAIIAFAASLAAIIFGQG